MSWEETYQTWKDNPELAADLKAELDQLADNQEALEDAFYEPLSFGTALYSVSNRYFASEFAEQRSVSPISFAALAEDSLIKPSFDTNRRISIGVTSLG